MKNTRRLNKKMLTVALNLVSVVCGNLISAQDDTSFSLLDEPSALVAEKVYNAFKTTKVVNLQSIELIDAGVFDFKMSHRFGGINAGAVNAFGLDIATIRFGGEYGVNQNLMLGLGRYNVKSEKGVDAYFKYRLMHQTSDNKNPLTIILFGGADYKNTRYKDTGTAIQENLISLNFGQRQAYVGQIIIGRKETDNFSWQISPTVVHYNWLKPLVNFVAPAQTQFAIGLGFRQKLSTRTSLNMEYIPILRGKGDYYNSFSVGFDVETGGHVFQFDFTNSIGLNESMFISRTTDRWSTAGVRFGFNLHRVFTVVDPSYFRDLKSPN